MTSEREETFFQTVISFVSSPFLEKIMIKEGWRGHSKIALFS